MDESRFFIPPPPTPTSGENKLKLKQKQKKDNLNDFDKLQDSILWPL